MKDELNEREVFLYVRVSTEDQAERGFSVDAQIKQGRAYCEARRWDLIDVFIDEGYSGRDEKRPEYINMLNRLKETNVILVTKMDRAHRNSRNFMDFMTLLDQTDTEFVSIGESLDTSTAIGRFVTDIIQRIAQLESEQIGERVLGGMTQKAETPMALLVEDQKSLYNGFNAPYGYAWEDGHLIADASKCETVRDLIFEERLTGTSLRQIATELNEKEIPPPKGTKWQPATIGNILTNPIYAGYIKWNGILKRGVHLSAVGIELFNSVQGSFRSRGCPIPYTPTTSSSD